MPATLDKPRPTHREQRPIRLCSQCGCFLRSFARETLCDPCATPERELVDAEEILAGLAEATQRTIEMTEALSRFMQEEPA